jgi:hypothetical protein
MFKKQSPIRRRLSDDNDVSYIRSRTLSGVANERAELQSERKHENNLRRRRRKLGFIFLILTIVILLGLALMSQFVGRLSVVTNVDGRAEINKAQYGKIADDYFSARPFERFWFAFSEQSFSDYMVSKMPEVKSAKVHKGVFIGGELELTFREPLAMWRTNDQTDYVDDTGAIFTKNYYSEPPISIIDNSGVTIDGGAIASRRFLQFVGQVASDVNAASIGQVKSITIPASAVRYVEFWIDGRPYPYKAQIDRDSKGQASDIANMAKYLDSRGLIPAYVDVRVAGKGYYK